MKKSEQKLINERCMIAYDNALEEDVIGVKRLRTCKAIVYETENY